LEPGDAVWLGMDVTADLWGNFGATGVDTLQHLFDKEGVKFAVVSFHGAANPVVFDRMVLPRVNQRDKVYGVDWVNIGYTEGMEAAMASVAADLTFPVKDFYGDLLADMPFFDDVKSGDDIDLAIYIGTGIGHLTIMMVGIPYNTRVITSATGMDVAMFLTYKQAGTLHGICVESVGAAQYELLRKRPGMAISLVDSISLLHVFMVAVVLVANAIYLFQRARGIDIT
jgi:hypothetical protein